MFGRPRVEIICMQHPAFCGRYMCLLSDAAFGTAGIAARQLLVPFGRCTEVASRLLQFLSEALARGLPVQAPQLSRQVLNIQRVFDCVHSLTESAADRVLSRQLGLGRGSGLCLRPPARQLMNQQ